MKEFLKTIFLGMKIDSTNLFLDDCIPLYFKYLESQENSENSEEFSHLPEIQIFHYINLFLSDFLFFFITNFCKYQGKYHTTTDHDYQSFTHRHLFSTNFSYFEEFLDYSLSLISFSFRNITSLYEISKIKSRLQETECEKTEYLMKDSYNHYGISLIFYLLLNGGYSPVNLLNEKDFVFETSFLPLILKKEFYLNLYLDAIYFILHTENNSEHVYMKDYKNFCFGFLIDIKNILLDGEISYQDKSFIYIVKILSEIAIHHDKDKIKEVFTFVKIDVN